MADQPQGLTPEAVNQLQAIAQNALTNPAVPKLYVNGFVQGVGFGDVYLVLQTNGQSSAVVNMTYATLKTLSESLTALVGEIEKQMGEPLQTLEEVQAIMTRRSEG